MALKWLGPINIAFSVLAVLAPMAHVLELPNKLSLDATLWLAVQQHLYRGWGPLLGAPTEVGALITSIIVAFRRPGTSTVEWPALVASAGYAGMLAAFFVLNLPVNTAVASWTSTSLPPDWTSYRAWWETGHAIAAVLSVISLTALLWFHSKQRST